MPSNSTCIFPVGPCLCFPIIISASPFMSFILDCHSACSIEHAEWQSKMNDIAGMAEILIGKQRHGPTGNIQVEFEGMYTKFKDLSRK